MRLVRTMPFAAMTFVVASLASMGLPGFSGFVAELQVLMGAWQAFPSLAILTGVGILIGVAYTLRAMQRGFFGEARPGEIPAEVATNPITWAERAGAGLLMAATLVIGLYPRLLLDWISEGLESPVFDGLRKAGLL
jgi:NADH-quinone oxidoreductase subunit M